MLRVGGAGGNVFSNSNGVTFGTGTNGVVTASVAGTVAGGTANVNFSAGTTSSGISAVTFSNANNVSFGLNGAGVITASVAPSGGGAGLSAGTQSVSTGTVNFANSNGISFGMSGSNQITASYTVPSTAGLLSAVNVSGGTTSNNLTNIVFSNSNGVSFGLNGSTMTASVAAGGAAGSISAGTTSVALGQAVFSNSNGVSFGLNGSTITASVAAGGAAGSISAGTTSVALGQAVFSNSNGVSFGLNGSTLTGSVSSAVFSNSNNVSFGLNAGTVTATATFAQTNQTLGLYASSQTTGQSSSSTVDARSLSVVGAGAISAGMSAGSLIISAPNTTTFTPLSVGVSTDGNTAGNTGVFSNQVVFVGSNNITLSGSSNAGSATISIIGGAGGGGVGISAGTQSVSTGTVVYSNSNNITFGMSGSSRVTASYAFNASAGTTSNNLNALTFSNLNGVSFGLNASTITASVAAQTNQTVGLYGVGNTTSNSSTTLDARTISYNGLGAATVGFQAGSVLISAPATSSLSATGMASISTNGSTISIGVGTGVTTGTGTAIGLTLTNTGISLVQAALTRLVYPDHMLTAVSAPGNASASFQYMPVQAQVTASRIDALVQWSASSSATTNTMGIALSAYAAIYTKNGATLSSLSSGSTQTTYTYASNSAGQTQLLTNAIRPISVPVNVNMGPGEYYVGFNFVTNTTSVGLSTTNLGQTLSIVGGANLQSSLNYAEFTNQTASSTNWIGGMGVYSAATTGLPAAVSLSAINQTGAALSQANIAIVMRNA